MQKAVFLPQLELNMESVYVAKWLVHPDERVHAEQPILEVETEKALVEVPSLDSGYLRKQYVKEGDRIGPKALLCILTDTPDEPIREESPTPRAALDATVRMASIPKTQSALNPPADTIRAAPAARKLAQELGIDLRQVKGTGPEGRITVEDVKSASTKDGSRER